MDQHLWQPDRGLLCHSWCQSQLIPALGGSTHCHHFLLPRQYLAPSPGLGHSTWAASSEDARGWSGICRPRLHFPEDPCPAQGQEGEPEGQTNRAGGWKECTPGPCPTHKQPPVDASLPFPLSLPSSSAHAQETSIPILLPSPVPAFTMPAPEEPGTTKVPLLGVT